MNTKQKKIQAAIVEKTSSLESVFGHFTDAQEKNVAAEIRRYDMLVLLREMRKKMGLTQAELAKRAAMPRTTITKIESGSYNPTIGTLDSIASAMDKKLQVMFV